MKKLYIDQQHGSLDLKVWIPAGVYPEQSEGPLWRMTLLEMTVIILFFLFANIAYAESFKMLIWYPGGEGDAANAEPILQEFSNQIKNISQGKLDLKINYSQEEISTVAYQKLNTYHFVILSHDAFLQSKTGPVKLTPILTTLPLPEGRVSEKYYLLQDATQDSKLFNNPILNANRPYSADFLKKYFPDLITLEKYQFQYQRNIIGVIKNLSLNKNQLVLVDAFQYASIKKLEMPWIKSLKIFATSTDVPSPKLLMIENHGELATVLTDALIKLQGSPVLLQLRLKGFSTQL